MEFQTNTIAAFRLINCLKGIGKTYWMVESIKAGVDELLMFEKDFEVLAIVKNGEAKKQLKKKLTDYYNKYVSVKTMHEIMYKISEFPIDIEHPYDVPQIGCFSFERNYKKFFVDPECFEMIAWQQLDKLKKIEEVLEER